MHRRSILKGIAATAGLSLVPSAWGETKQGRWLRLESPNFVLHSTEWEDKSRNELIALERFHNLMQRLMPRDVQGNAPKLHVYAAGTERDFSIAEPTNPIGVVGFYEARLEQIRAVTSLAAATTTRRSDGSRNVRNDNFIRPMDSRVILFHEYSHHFARSSTRVVYPTWYQEGFAEFLSTAEFGDNDCTLGKVPGDRAQWLLYGTWLPIEAFIAGDLHQMNLDASLQYYAQAWLAAHYLFSQPKRMAGFDKYCAALQQGGDPLGVFEASFGVGIAAFDQELQAYRKSQINQFRFPANAADKSIAVTITRLDNGYDQVLLPLSHLRSTPSAEVAAPSVAIIRAGARKFPSHGFVRRADALAEVWYGDPAVARTKLDALLVDEPQEPETLHLSGLCDLKAGYASDDAELFKKARKSFALAQKIDPSRSGSLFRYVECLLHEADEVTPHMLDVLVMAYNQSPQIDEIALVTAQALMVHERFEEAACILQPMVGALHSGGKAQFAAELLAFAKAEKADYFAFVGALESFGGGEKGGDDK